MAAPASAAPNALSAISAGVTILEVQQNSDTTYRLWDWGRAGRATHVEQALRVARFGAPTQGPPTHRPLSGS